MTNDKNPFTRDFKGNLTKCSPYGGYPLFYWDSEDTTLCPDCANRIDKDPENELKIVAVEINWEDTGLWCEDCSERIESAYAD